MPRKTIFTEQLRLPLPAGMTATIDAALTAGEARVDFIRSAIEREIKRRSRAPKPRSP